MYSSPSLHRSLRKQRLFNSSASNHLIIWIRKALAIGKCSFFFFPHVKYFVKAFHNSGCCNLSSFSTSSFTFQPQRLVLPWAKPPASWALCVSPRGQRWPSTAPMGAESILRFCLVLSSCLCCSGAGSVWFCLFHCGDWFLLSPAPLTSPSQHFPNWWHQLRVAKMFCIYSLLLNVYYRALCPKNPTILSLQDRAVFEVWRDLKSIDTSFAIYSTQIKYFIETPA